MAERDRETNDDQDASLDPELLYSKEYCIGQTGRFLGAREIIANHSLAIQAVAALARCTKGLFGCFLSITTHH
jgi:hypothetical protein